MARVTAKEMMDKDLFGKRRTAADLIRHLKTREEKSTANYSLLLGAGASVTSGIRTASTLVGEWAVELYERFESEKAESPQMALEYFEKNHPQWFNSSYQYSSLFEKKFDLPSQRRRFVEQEVDKKLPSIGYAYLTSLVDHGYLNTIFTTNFDDLINEAFYLLSNERPILCAHDSSVHSISIASKRPKIIKLHGDYLFDDIKSTLRETESLEQNTKEKFVEFGKEFGLIVVGYSGNDRSIMDVIEFLVKQENYLKNGVYWCLRPDDEICHALRNLLWKEKVYPVLIDGFDEFFAECHESLVGADLNLTASTKNSKLQRTIQQITDDNYGVSRNSIIKREIENIQKHNNSKDISDFIRGLSDSSLDDSRLEIADLRNLLEIKSLSEKGELDRAYQLCEEFYYDCKSEGARSRYVHALIDISEELGEELKALKWCDKLIEFDENNINYIVRKSRNIKNMHDRVEYLKKESERNKYSTTLMNRTAHAIKRVYDSSGHRSDIELAIKYLENSLAVDPSLDNAAWIELQTCYLEINRLDKKPLEGSDADNLARKARTQHPEHTQTLKIVQVGASEKKDVSETKGVINLLYGIHARSSKSKRKTIDIILSKLLSNLDNYSDRSEFRKELYKFYESHINISLVEDSSVILGACAYNISDRRDLEAAKDLLRLSMTKRDIVDNFSNLIVLAGFVDRESLQDISKLLDKSRSDLFVEYYFSLKSDICVATEAYEDAERYLMKAHHEGLDLETFLTSISYLYLLQKKYNLVIGLLDRYKPDLAQDKFEPFQVNYLFSAKAIKSPKYNEIAVRNLSAQSKSDDVKICAFKILGQDNEAKRLIKKNIEKNYIKYHYYSRWPILDKDFLDKSLPEGSESVA